MKGKKVLILNSFLKEFTGSEIVTLELASYFLEKGASVTVACFSYLKPLKSEFDKIGISIKNISNLDAEDEFDFIWSHHFTTIEYVLLNKRIKAETVIFSSLSHFTALECPPLILDKITHLLANSEENKEHLIKLGFKASDIKIFPNPVPESFFRKDYKRVKTLKKVAIVSNHIPNELNHASELLEKKGIKITKYGKGYNETRVTPEILSEFDAVITIGKTVQYCFAIGIPVYCYDIFGGSGWVTNKNFIQVAKYNFSGRDNSKVKLASDIANEIILYNEKEFSFYKEKALNNYHLDKCIKDIIEGNIQNNIFYDVKLLKNLRERQQGVYDNHLFDMVYAQCYFSKDENFLEQNSIIHKINVNSYNRIKFELNRELTSIRIDISTIPARISELKIKICSNGLLKDINLDECSLVQIENINGDYYVWGCDPQIRLDVLMNYVQYIEVSFIFDIGFSLNHYLEKRHNKLMSLESESENLREQLKISFKEKMALESQSVETLKKLSQLEHKLDQILNSKAYKMISKIKKFTKLFLKFLNKDDYSLISRTKLFNHNYYLNNNKDIKVENIDPVSHYLERGWKEGRNPSELFNNNLYLELYPDVKESNMNPLIHYLKHGYKEGRIYSKNMPKSKATIINGAIKLIIKNPNLIKKFIFLAKNNGFPYALNKIKNKLNKNEVLQEGLFIEEKINISNLLQNLNKNQSDKITRFYNSNPILKPIDIIIPIYNGYEFLENLFDSIVKNTTLPYRLLIANDKSPDIKVREFIINFIDSHPELNIKFIDNQENLGFLKTVNKLVQYAENHLVILNTDTELPRYWLERLMYPILSKQNIASTTPFTNSGTICSFPEYLVDNSSLYKDLSLEQIDSLFGYIDVDSTMIDVPTGVGFCMGMNFNVIQKIGMFDEIYGKGYGEENDWCQRAIQAGFRNVHITNLFVYHKHGGSFLSEDKIRYINEHYQLLLNKFPTYDKQIQETIKENKLLSVRKIMKAMIDFNHCTTDNVLFIDHSLGGGANLYRYRKIDELIRENKGIICLLYNINRNEYTIEFISAEYKESFVLDKEQDAYSLIEVFKIDTVFVNGLVSFTNVLSTLDHLISLTENKKVSKIIFPIHDYFCVSPNYTLLGNDNIYSGVPLDNAAHTEFLKKSKGEFKLFCNETNALIWRTKWEQFLSKCTEILCFSHSSEKIILSMYPQLEDKLVYIPHTLDDKFENIYIKPEIGTRKVIGILGNINLPKGREVIHNLVKHIDSNNLDIGVVLIGNIDIDISSQNFFKTGSYNRKDIPSLIKKHGITEFIIPSVCPETFSYTTDEIMQLGYPLSVFDLGAPAERVSNYEKGRILPLDGYLEILCK